MQTQKYSVNQNPIETILTWVKSGEIAIPEIQRPFVWDSSKVRDLMDSLYQGFPIGYVIAWRNPGVKLKDGSTSDGKRVLIDGQQRITALTAAVLGDWVVDKKYRRIKIRIAFNPLLEKFEVQNNIILKDKEWIPDIAEVFGGKVDQYDLVDNYLLANPEADKSKIRSAITNLVKMPLRQIGMIELASDLDIDVVTEIFIRINSQGVVLSQADFVMSKIAANESYGGNELRKAIDYFCHLAIAPEFFSNIRDHDEDFSQTEYFQKMTWLKDEKDDLYDPTYTDMIRVAFTSEFNRGKLSDLVSLLSGRNFETRSFEEEIAKSAFVRFGESVKRFMNETNFKRFLMHIKSAGFITSGLINAQNALNFAYIIYLKQRSEGLDEVEIGKNVTRWFVYSMLTGHYSGSAESVFDYDIRQMTTRSFNEMLREKEEGVLSDGFWNVSLVQRLETSNSNSPYFNVFLAAQVKGADKGFLSSDITVGQLIEHRGDMHHIFPKDVLKKRGLPRSRYNQISNFVYTQQEINIKIGNKPVEKYFNELGLQCNGGPRFYGGITSMDQLIENFEQNCIPLSVLEMTADDYDEFLLQRRKLMAEKMKAYYFSL